MLDSVEAYFNACHELPSPSIAFTATTERRWGRGNAYHPLSDFPADMPYFCLRVPPAAARPGRRSRVEDEESRKVYQSSGALMHYFDNLSPTQRDGLLSEGVDAERSTPCSLANMLRLRHPTVQQD